MCETWVRRGQLLVPFEVPELTVDDSIERGWQRSDDGRMMVPKPREYMTTRPLPGFTVDRGGTVSWHAGI